MKTPNFKISLALTLLAFIGTALAATQWRTDPKQSTLVFSGVQAGAPFEGRFERFTADIRFDPKDLGGSRFDVSIDLTSVNSKDKDRDTTMKGNDIFATAKYPTAHYVASSFTDKGAGKYSATGQLTLRGVTRPVPLEFTFQLDASGALLRGTAALKRLDFGVGQGDWKNTEWIGNDVQVRFALRLQNAS